MRFTKTQTVAIAIGLTLSVAGCGKKDKDEDGDEDSDPAGVPMSPGSGTESTPELATGAAVVGYALKALSSATVSDGAGLALDSTQDATFPECSNNGEPWDTTAGARMQPSNAAFAERTFHCQLRYPDSSETVRGSFEQNQNILCDVERLVGTLAFTEAGTTYETHIVPTVGCGWAQSTVDEITAEAGADGFAATLVAKSYASGDWDKSLSLDAGDAGVNFTMYIKNGGGVIAFKQVQAWTQAARKARGDYNAAVDDDATGYSVGLVSLDTAGGVLRAETGDTYWGRRARLYVKGDVDLTTGEFSDITEGSGIVSNFDASFYNGQTSLYGEVASVKGDSTGGFKFRSARYGCDTSNGCDVLTSVRTGVTLSDETSSCSDGDCAAQTGLALDTEKATLDFLMLGVVFDDQDGAKAAWEAWADDAGLPTFTEVTKAPAL
jgi:hypothetical protein